MTPLSVGSTIGILGGGQLGRMLAGAAAQLGFDTIILSPEADCPASRVAADHIQADYTDEVALKELTDRCDVITYEFENVPVKSAKFLISAGAVVRPGSAALEKAQDRVAEKTFLQQSGIPTADFAAINEASQIADPLQSFDGSGILKTRRDGYDGKGQVRLKFGDDYEAAHKALGHAPCILEAMVPFEKEISVVVARGVTGDVVCFDPPHNEHVNGILRRSTVPSGIMPTVEEAAKEAGAKLVKALDYVGVLALEFFVLEDGRLLANEYAPRVHNSGHWTPEACATGQFEQHIRAIVGWPLGDTTRFHDVEMLNLLGEDAILPDLDLSGDHQTTLYGKRDALPGRKMGHIVRRLKL